MSRRQPAAPVDMALVDLAEHCCYNIGRCLVLVSTGELAPIPTILEREIERRRGHRWAHVQAADAQLAHVSATSKALGTQLGLLVHWLIEAQRNPLRNLDLEQAAILARGLCHG